MVQDRRTPYRDTLLGIGQHLVEEPAQKNQGKSDPGAALLAATLLGGAQRSLGVNDLLEALYGSKGPERESAEPHYYDPFEASRKRPAGPAVDAETGNFAEALRALLGDTQDDQPPLVDGMHQVAAVGERIAVVRHHCASNTYRVYTVKPDPQNRTRFLPAVCIGTYPTRQAAEERAQAYGEAYAHITEESAALQTLTNLFAAPQP